MSSPKIYVIADTHFGHRKIVGFEPDYRPFNNIEEHDRTLVERWNQVVRPKDTVWHLGDVLFAMHKTGEILGSLNGIKRLILGNHDRFPLEMYAKYFSKIYGAAPFGQCILTHVPVHPNQVEYRFMKNIHGHMHSKKLDDSRYVCVSVEQLPELKPYLLQTAIQHGIME